MEFRHVTVLRDEVLRLLEPKEGTLMLDATLGGGGHSEALLEKGARVIGFDRDPKALAAATARLARFADRLATVATPFAQLSERLMALGITRLDGVIADLGISSPQIDVAERGFSFRQEGPLDMRMGDEGETAAELIARLDEASLAKVIAELGEESFARRIARAIKSAPRPLVSTLALAETVAGAIPRKAWPQRIHPATKTFQALRLAVNDELGQLETFLRELPPFIAPGGRVAVISFHSLEDRRVKETFREWVGQCRCPPGFPICACGATHPYRLLTPKALVASDEESAQNPRARSARLRVIERIP